SDVYPPREHAVAVHQFGAGARQTNARLARRGFTVQPAYAGRRCVTRRAAARRVRLAGTTARSAGCVRSRFGRRCLEDHRNATPQFNVLRISPWTGANPSMTDCILEEPAKCSNCRREVLEETLVQPT